MRRIFPAFAGSLTPTRRITLVLAGLAAVTLLSTGTLTAVGTVRLRSAPLAETSPFLTRPDTPRVVVPDSTAPPTGRPGQSPTGRDDAPPGHASPGPAHSPAHAHRPDENAAPAARDRRHGPAESAHRPSVHGPTEAAHPPEEPRHTGEPPASTDPAIRLPDILPAVTGPEGATRIRLPDGTVTVIGLPVAPARTVPPGGATGDDRAPTRTASPATGRSTAPDTRPPAGNRHPHATDRRPPDRPWWADHGRDTGRPSRHWHPRGHHGCPHR